MAKQLIDILLESGKLTKEDLTKAELYCKQNEVSLNEALVSLDILKEEELTQAMSKQLSVPYASIQNGILNPEKDQNLAKYIPEKYARENVVLPLFVEDNTLAVALNDPSNVFLLDNLRMMSGLEIQPFISSKSQLFQALDAFYSKKDLLAEVISEDKKETEEVATGEDLDAIANPGAKIDLDKEVSGTGAHYVKMVNAILRQALTERVSDIHLELFDERVSLRFRIDGSLYERTVPYMKGHHLLGKTSAPLFLV